MNTELFTAERPESVMTVGSDCSSTISSEDEHPHTSTSSSSSSPVETDQDGSSSRTVITASPAKRCVCSYLDNAPAVGVQ